MILKLKKPSHFTYFKVSHNLQNIHKTSLRAKSNIFMTFKQYKKFSHTSSHLRESFEILFLDDSQTPVSTHSEKMKRARVSSALILYSSHIFRAKSLEDVLWGMKKHKQSIKSRESTAK